MGSVQRAGTTGASPRDQATSTARQLLRAFAQVVPTSARPIQTLPPSLDKPAWSIATSQMVSLTARYEVPGVAPEALQGQLQDHAVAGTRVSGGGSSSGPSGVQYLVVSYSPTRTPPAVYQASLVVTIGWPTSGSGSVMRVDAEVPYVYPHPLEVTVPADVPNATVSRRLLGLASPTNTVTLRPGKLLAEIVAAFNATPAYPPIVRSCPNDFGVRLQLSFAASARTPVLAVSVDNCAHIEVELGGHSAPALWDYVHDTSGRLGDLLGSVLGFHGYSVWQRSPNGEVKGQLVRVGGPPSATPVGVPGRVELTGGGGHSYEVQTTTTGELALTVPPGTYRATGHSPMVISSGREMLCQASQPVVVAAGSDQSDVAVICNIR